MTEATHFRFGVNHRPFISKLKSGSYQDYTPPINLIWNYPLGTWGELSIKKRVIQPQYSTSTAKQGRVYHVPNHIQKMPTKPSPAVENAIRTEFLTGNFPRIVDSYKPDELAYTDQYNASTSGRLLPGVFDKDKKFAPESRSNSQGYGLQRNHQGDVSTFNKAPY